MGPEGRGQFASVMQPITVAAAVASLGLPAAAAYFVSKSFDAKGVYRKCILGVALSASATYAFLLWYASVVSARQDISFIFLSLAWTAVVVSAVIQVRRGIWQGLGAWRLLDYERGAFSISRFAFVVILAGVGVTLAEWYVVASLLAFVVSAVLIFRPFRAPVSGGGDQVVSPVVYKFAAAASVTTIVTVVSSRADQLLMPAAASSVELGYYAIAVTVAEVPLVFAALAARNALNYAARGLSLRVIAEKVSVYVVVCIASSACIALISPLVIPGVFGNDFTPSVSATQLLAFSSIATVLSLVTSAIVSGRGYPGVASTVSGAYLLVTAVGFGIYWKDISSTSAAWIALLSSIVSAAVALIVLTFFQKRINVASAVSASGV